MVIFVSSTFAAPTPTAGILTVLDGQGLLTRGLTRYQLAEGLRVEKGDIVELGDDSFAVVELFGGAVVAAGPRARMLLVSAPGKLGAIELFLLQGPSKATTRGSPALRFVTPPLAVTLGEGTAVVQSDPAATSLFMERGEAKAQESGDRGAAQSVIVRSGEFCVRKLGQKSEVTPRPPASFVSALPRPFLDDLPSRLDKFKDRDVEPKKAPDFVYADVEPWLKTSAAVRKLLVPRWRAKAKDPAFRKALVANLKDHPEWDQILFPEKYDATRRPKPAAAARQAPYN